MARAGKPTSIVLCGGKTRRFGSNKALAAVAGRTVIGRIFDVLAPLSGQIILVTPAANSDFPVPDSVTPVPDVYPERGPLGGIYTGLLNAGSDLSIVVGCDMPFLNAGLLIRMLELAGGFDAVVPKLGAKYIEPLHAVYARTCLPKMKTCLESGQLSLWRVLQELHIRYLEKEEYLALDPRMLSFFNINTPQDLERANRIASKHGAQASE